MSPRTALTDPPVRTRTALEDPPSLLDAALAYAASGIPVFPTHGVDRGRCTCSKPDCSNIGKHPLTANGFKDATTDATTIHAWWTKWPLANIGVPTGAASGWVVIDVDVPKPGATQQQSGAESLRALQAQCGALPPTRQHRTGRGGAHFLFQHPGGNTLIKSTAPIRREAPGVDVRGDGGYIVAPPSVGAAMPYTVIDDCPPAPLPEAWLTLLRPVYRTRDPRRSGDSDPTTIPEGRRNMELTTLAGRLRRLGLSASELLATLQVLNVARCATPLPEAEVATIAHSVARYEPAPQWPILQEAALHGLAGRFVRAADPYTEADPVAVLLQLLAAVGNMIDAGPHAIAGEDVHPCRLSVALVGETSTARKGTALGVVLTMLKSIDRDWVAQNIKRGLSSGEGVIHHVRDRVTGRREVKRRRQPGEDIEYEDYIEDQGVADKRLLVVETELSTVLKRMTGETNTLSELMRQMWDAGDLGTLTRHNPLRATGAHVSLLAHITRVDLLRHLTETDQANGFGNRLLIALVKRSKVLPRAPRIPVETLAPLVAEMRIVEAFARTVRVVPRTEAAEERWAVEYPLLTQEVGGLVGALTARGAPQVLRLSVLYAVLDRSAVVDVVHLEAALALWAYCRDSVRFIFRGKLGSDTADTILAALREQGAMTATTISSDLFHRNKPQAEILAAVTLLSENGLISSFTVAAEGDRGGRPVTWWQATTQPEAEPVAEVDPSVVDAPAVEPPTRRRQAAE